MDILIAYAGKTGTTKKCAELLAQELKNAKVVNLNQETPDINKYDLIIIGGSIRIGQLHSKAKDFINKNKEILLNKKVAYYICCGFIEDYKKYFEENIEKDLLASSITYNTFGGEMDITKQKGFEKIVVKLVAKATENGKTKTQTEILHKNIDDFIDVINRSE